MIACDRHPELPGLRFHRGLNLDEVAAVAPACFTLQNNHYLCLQP